MHKHAQAYIVDSRVTFSSVVQSVQFSFLAMDRVTSSQFSQSVSQSVSSVQFLARRNPLQSVQSVQSVSQFSFFAMGAYSDSR